MNTADSIDDIRIELLDDNLQTEIISKLETIIHYYLHELNPDASLDKKLSYICYMTSTISNYTGPMAWGYISNITTENLLHYFKCRSKQERIFFDGLINDINGMYLQVVTSKLFDKALNKNKSQSSDYNRELNHLYDLIFYKMPENDQFQINKKCNLIEFSTYLSKMDSTDFSYVLNYLTHIELIVTKDIPTLLRFFYDNNHNNTK